MTKSMDKQQFPPEVDADLREYMEKGPKTARMIGGLTIALLIILLEAISILL